MNPPHGLAAATRRRDPGPWPDAAQTLLLHAALGDSNRARAAVARLRDSIDLAGLDPASRRILPLVWWNLQRHQIHDANPDAFKRSFAETWVRNQQIVEALGAVLAAFQSATVPLILFKGAGLALGTYANIGLRPMVDIDILVPHSAMTDASRLLEALGAVRSSKDPAQRRAMLHGIEYVFEREQDSVAIDLHQSALWECRRPGDDDRFWADSIALPGTILGARTLCPAHHLIVVCVHGLRWSQVRPIHWIADAMTLIDKAQPSMDWPRVVAEARRRRVEWTLAVALRFLAEVFQAGVPATVIEELASSRSPLRDRLELACRSRRPDPLRGLVLHWFDHTRRSAFSSLPKRLIRFPAYLREMWALDSLWAVPAQGFHKALRRWGLSTRKRDTRE